VGNDSVKENNEIYTKNVNTVINTEIQHIEKAERNGTKENSSSMDKRHGRYGLALSGGGIRSAAFGLGVIQGLEAGGCFKEIDYLSTVSGGGYIGSALTWFLYNNNKKGEDAQYRFPFGSRKACSRNQQGGKENAFLDFIRQHCNYLLPGNGLDMISLFAVVVRTMCISLFVYLTMMITTMIIFFKINVFETSTLNWRSVNDHPKSLTLCYPIWLAIILVAVLTFSYFWFSMRTRLAVGSKTERYEWLIKGQICIGWGWKSVFALLFIGSLPYAGGCFKGIISQAFAAGGTTIIGMIIGFYQFKKQQNMTEPSSAIALVMNKILLIIGVFALIYGLVFIAYSIGGWVDYYHEDYAWHIAAVLFVFSAIIGICVNMNYVGIFRMYRDRLMETFLPNFTNVNDNKWGLATDANKTLLEDIGKSPFKPYHLINSNIVLVDSSSTKYRGRGGDSFILSPLFCGSDATGWCQTKEYMKTDTRTRRRMTLPTAMSISAAAVNPNAGVGGKGLTRNKLLSVLMSLLNIRTGYWAFNPKPNKTPILPFMPNFMYPGLKGLLGFGLSEDGRSVELTDGGHFENLGVYELIRRKLSVIIVSDAGADPDFNFADLANAVERTRVDFGAMITFCESNHHLNNILPKSDVKHKRTEDEVFAVKYKLAKQGFAIGDIYYHDHDPESAKPDGILIYLKTTLIPDLPPDIYGYKSANKDFPDQSTGDQFFDEAQFEAYRELGYQITKKMVITVKKEHPSVFK
jgi:hypothetical protein